MDDSYLDGIPPENKSTFRTHERIESFGGPGAELTEAECRSADITAVICWIVFILSAVIYTKFFKGGSRGKA